MKRSVTHLDNLQCKFLASNMSIDQIQKRSMLHSIYMCLLIYEPYFKLYQTVS